MHRLLFRAYNIDGAMNVAWRGTQRPVRGPSEVETSSRMGVVTGDAAAGRMRRRRNGIIDLEEGGGLRDSRRPAVCQGDPGTLGLTIFQVR